MPRCACLWFGMPSVDGTLRCMKKTLQIDEKTLRDAREACGASTDTETIRLGLESLIRHAAYQRLSQLAGSEKNAVDVPRRREPASANSRSR